MVVPACGEGAVQQQVPQDTAGARASIGGKMANFASEARL